MILKYNIHETSLQPPRYLPNLSHIVGILRIAYALEELVVIPTFIFILHVVTICLDTLLPVVELII